MSKNPKRISSVFDFLSKKLDEKNDDERIQNILELFGIETKKCDENIIFYLVKCEVFDGLSLLEFIDSQNVLLTRQREELIDLSVKIAHLNHRDDTKKAMEEVINNYKSGLPSGVGLRDMITMVKERYPWSSSKKVLMTLVSFMTLLLGVGLYVFDVKTDIQFSIEMFNKNKDTTLDDPCPVANNTREFLLETLEFYPSCVEASVKCFNLILSRAKDCLSMPSSPKNLHEDFQNIAYLSLWHCIQPFFFVLIVFVNKANKRHKKRYCPE